MLDRIRGNQHARQSHGLKSGRRRQRQTRRDIRPELLEGRQLMTASLSPISGITVPAQMGYQVPLDGSGSTGSSQTYTVTSSNPDIGATIAQGPYLTLGVSHVASSSSDVGFSGNLVFQLFGDLTSNTVSEIEQFVSDGYYVGKDFTRILNGFPGATDYIAQAGAPNADGSGSSGQAGTPFANQAVQQLAFTGPGQLALANAGGTDTNDTQFFVTTGAPSSLDYNYTIFGQLVSGQAILTELTQVAVTTNTLTNEPSLPISPVTITSATISASNVDGVVHINTTQATLGETATITVTATDPSDGSKMSQSFNVVVGGYNGPTSPPINFRPYADSTTVAVTENNSNVVNLGGVSGNPTASTNETFAYSLVSQPLHGTITGFNSSTGAFFYTPNPGYVGSDTIQYQVQSTNSTMGPVTLSNVGTLTLVSGPNSTNVMSASVPIPTTSQVAAVSLDQVDVVQNKKHQVVSIVAHFTGSLNSNEASQRGYYRLVTAGKSGSFTSTSSTLIPIRKPVYNNANDTVTFTPTKPFGLKKSVQLLIHGAAPTGLLDSSGRFIDGANNGQTGSDATADLSTSGIQID